MKEKVKYLKHCVFHPFDGFYEAKNRGKGSVLLAAVILAIYGVLQCVRYQYTGFIMNLSNIYYMNSVTIFISSLSVFLLFVLSNWTITTLFDGKGKLADIFMVTCYSLIPMIVTQIVLVFISNYVIMEEVAILDALQYIAMAWSIFMGISGLCTIHEFGLAKTFITLLATAVAAVIILFLGVLFISLTEQMVGFFVTFFKEFLRRI